MVDHGNKHHENKRTGERGNDIILAGTTFRKRGTKESIATAITRFSRNSSLSLLPNETLKLSREGDRRPRWKVFGMI